MKIGLALPNTHKVLATRSLLTRGAVQAERCGFSSIWVNDHIAVPDRLERTDAGDRQAQYLDRRNQDIIESLVLIGHLSALTSTIAIGTSVFGLPLRNPVVAAKQLGSLDHLSESRLLLGVGLGWMREEYEILNVPYKTRGRRVDEWLGVLKSLWSSEVASFDGEFFSFEDAVMRPRPREGAIPIWIGGRTEAGARRAARAGDAWHPSHFTVEEFRNWIPTLAGYCAEAGRSPEQVEVTSRRRVRLDDPGTTDLDEDRLLGGPADRMVEGLRRLEGVGVSHMILELDTNDENEFLDQVEWLGDRVIGPFAGQH
jgi:probable F420-dependent oxidoreductase